MARLAIDPRAWQQRAPLAALVAFLILGQAWSLQQLRFRDVAFVEMPKEQEAKWDPSLVRMLSFGQLPTTIDLLWLRVLADPAYAHVLAGQHAPAYYDLDLATDLDPAFFELYHLGSYLLSIVRNDNTGARDLLEKGRRFHREALSAYPESFQKKYWGQAWGIYLTLAYVYLFELQDMPQAARVFREAAEIPGAPVYLQSLKERLARTGGEYDVALRLLNHLIEQAPDEPSRERLMSKRRSLLLSQYLHVLNERFRAFVDRDPAARRSQQVPRELAERLWRAFQAQERLAPSDPWGGRLSLGPSGRIVSTTPHERVFGLE